MTTSASERLSDLHIVLPQAPPDAEAFVQTIELGNFIITSGHIAVDGENGLIATGKVGAEIDIEGAVACARQCALNILAQLEKAVGELDRIERIVKLTVFVASTPDFIQQSVVANGASELFKQICGEAGVHTRSAIGVAALPFDSPVEIEAIVQVRR